MKTFRVIEMALIAVFSCEAFTSCYFTEEEFGDPENEESMILGEWFDGGRRTYIFNKDNELTFIIGYGENVSEWMSFSGTWQMSDDKLLLSVPYKGEMQILNASVRTLTSHTMVWYAEKECETITLSRVK